MKSSIDLFGQYAKCSGSKVSGSDLMMKSLTSLSKRFTTHEIRATGLLLRQTGLGFFGTGTIMDCLKRGDYRLFQREIIILYQ